MFAKFIFLVLFHCSSGVIYELSDEDYARMPKLFHMDDYEACLEDPQGLFCVAELTLVSDEPSPLLNMIQEYSAFYPSHYNHSLLRRGICITQTCKKFYEVSEGDLGSALEACANETLYNGYKLKAKMKKIDCSRRERDLPIGYLDIAVAVVCVAILIANIVASYCDYFYEKGKNTGGLRFLYCFSVFRNWNKLVAPAAEGRDPRVKRLTSLNGMKTLNIFFVIGGHSIIRSVFLVENERFIEEVFNAGPMHIVFSATLIMQTFMLNSTFLLVYNWLIYSEKNKTSWKILPKLFMLRWLRLTPSYALILALTTTWFGRIASGPYWMYLVGEELYDCRRVWWKHLLYINNYENNAICMLQSWYLAADTQLYYLASTVFVLCQTARSRKVVLSLLLVIGVAVPTLITYFRNLDGILLVYPEFALSVFMNYPTFDEIYKRGHTNMTGCIIGMALGYWVYDWQKTGVDVKSLRKYRFFYLALLPLGVLCFYASTVYYSYSPGPSLFVNLLFAAFTKPTFAIIIGVGIIGTIFQIEDVYRTILEWRVWTIPSRLSFSAYLMHIVLLRNEITIQTTTHTTTGMLIMKIGLTLVASSLVAGFFLYILVEGPFSAVIRECFFKPEPIAQSKDKDVKKIRDTEIDRNPKTSGVAYNNARKRIINNIDDKTPINSAEKNR